MSWWNRIFGTKKTEKSEPAPRASLVHDVRMTIDGWHEDPASGTMRNWHHPDGRVLSLDVVSRRAVPPLSQPDLLRKAFRRLAEQKHGGLVEADVVESAYGPSIRMIYKWRQDLALVFTGMALLPVENGWLVFTTVDAERGTTGVREAVVTAQLIAAGQMTIETYAQSWARDPYDPDYSGVADAPLRNMSDDERYDRQFPEHPLSNVRNTLAALLENVFMDE